MESYWIGMGLLSLRCAENIQLAEIQNITVVI